MGEQTAHEKIGKLRKWLHLHKLSKPVRLIVVGAAGGICLVAGIIMIVTPGPAFVLIPLGLLLLASEFKWAERWAQKALDGLDTLRDKWRASKRRRSAQSKS
ncbi:MAG TPA: PGPGW domain-containing protein [Methylomirabilota bacterium]|nr:PGPGW domain-containing protein [Methylomirabilota bacterium]